MFTGLAMVYTAVALAFLAAALVDIRRRVWGESMADGYDRALLVGVGVTAAAAWPLLVPVYAAGWLGSAHAREVGHGIARGWDPIRRRIARLPGIGWITH